MRIILFFDLPMITSGDIKRYNKFRKLHVKEGFIMMQKSVYTKLVINASSVKLVKNKIEKNKPQDGIVQILTVTEKQFASIECIVGERKTNVIDSTERVLII